MFGAMTFEEKIASGACTAVPMLLGEWIEQGGANTYPDSKMSLEGFLICSWNPEQLRWISISDAIELHKKCGLNFSDVSADKAVKKLLELVDEKVQLTQFTEAPEFSELPLEDRETILGVRRALGDYIWFYQRIVKKVLTGV